MKVTPKDFFLWAGAMVALYFSIGSFITLSFEYINYWFGPYAIADLYTGGMRFSIAALIVLFPVYIALMRILQQDIRHTPEKKDLWVRKWLVFLTVFGAAIAMIVDLIVLLNVFLSGEELTAAFLLKTVTVLAVAAGVFYYYIHDVRGTWQHNEKKSKNIARGVSLLVLVAVVGAFFVMGTPSQQRMLRNDSTRMNDLENIESQLTDYYRTTEKLPTTLDALKDPLVGGYFGNDPATGEPYEYATTGTLSFELCATFELPFPEIDETRVDTSNWRTQEMLRQKENWNHAEGRTCFTRTIDTERITPYSKTRMY